MLPKTTNHIRRAKPLLGTIVDIALHSNSHTYQELTELSTRCFNRIKDIQSKMSFFEPDSDIFRLNNSEVNTPITIDPETLTILKIAETMCQESSYAFDIHSRSRSQYPTARLSFHSDGRVSKNYPSQIDLGGIAKGFAADQAADSALTVSGISGVINAGGDIRFFGEQAFPLSIRSPLHNGQFLDSGNFHNCAVATSIYSSAENQLISISVQAPTCLVADALTKALRVMESPKRDLLLSKYSAHYMEISGDLKIIGGESFD